MRPDSRLLYPLAAALDEDRHRDEDRRHAHYRALREAQGESPPWRERLQAAFVNLVRRDDHSLTNYPCRLPSGGMGRVAVVQQGGDWTMVCRAA